jgi:hypothetical protein
MEPLQKGWMVTTIFRIREPGLTGIKPGMTLLKTHQAAIMGWYFRRLNWAKCRNNTN